MCIRDRGEGDGVRQAAVLVLLQAHALALGHFRQIGQWEHQHLAVVAHHGDMIAQGLAAQRGFYACAKGQHLFAGAGLRLSLIHI